MERLEARLERLEDTHRSVIAAPTRTSQAPTRCTAAILRILEPTDFEEFLTVLDTDVSEILRVDSVKLVLESRAAHRTRHSAARTRLSSLPNRASSTTTSRAAAPCRCGPSRCERSSPDRAGSMALAGTDPIGSLRET